MKKRVMIVGPRQSGKSSLANLLNDTKRPLKRSQDSIYGRRTIDTPSSYLEIPTMHRYLIALAQDASHVLLIVDLADTTAIYPPAFAKVLNGQILGIMTKVDLAPENIPWAKRQLERLGVQPPYFEISCVTNTGVKELKKKLTVTEK